MERWKNKVAIVTGASSCIGAAIAEKLAQNEIIVVGLDPCEDKLKEVSQRINEKKQWFYPYVANDRKETDILKAFEWTIAALGPIHILISKDVIYQISSFDDVDDMDPNEVLLTNDLELSVVTRMAIQHMTKENINGHIIYLNSRDGDSCGLPSKDLLKSLQEGLDYVVSKRKIKISSIRPGLVATNIIPSTCETIRPPVPNHLKPEDVANSVVYVLGTPPHVQVDKLIIKPIGAIP